VEIRILGAGDASVLENVADGVFDDAVNPKLSADFLSDPRHHMCAALDDGVVVGFGSAVHYVHPDKPAQLWINEVGVADSHQKRGIGKAIVWRLVGLAGELGCSEAWVLTEDSNTAARALYRSAGGEETTGVVMTTFPVKAPSET
jgi:ribosomal protein S18 acetylase RimI-like enzyme